VTDSQKTSEDSGRPKNFIQIVEDGAPPFPWQWTSDAGKMDTQFMLKVLPEVRTDALREKHTTQVWNKRSHQKEDKFDRMAYLADVLDEGITSWTGLVRMGTQEELPCVREIKNRLPEACKLDILRVVVGKEIDGSDLPEA